VTTEDRMDQVSSLGYGLGYIGGSTIPLIISLVLIQFGSAIGISSALSVTKMISMLTGLQLSIPIGTCIESSALALLCGVLSGILPAYRASRLDPIDVIIR